MTELNIADRIRDVFAIDGQANALEYGGNWHSWADLDALMARIDAALDAAGVGKGMPVGVVTRNRPAHVATYLALILAGRTIVTLNPMQPSAVVAEDLASLGLSAVIADVEDWDDALVAAARDSGAAGLSLRQSGLPAVDHVPGLGQVGTGPFRAPVPGVIAEMLTSGTTGKPKRIQIHADPFLKSLEAGVWSSKDKAGAPLRLKRSPSILYVPILHISGFYRCIFAFFEGRPTVLIDKFSVKAWRDAVVTYRPKIIGLPPTALRMVLDADLPRADLESLMAVTVGTAPLDIATRMAFEQRYGVPVLCNYGATEFLGPVATWTLADHKQFGTEKIGSVGRATRGTEFRVVDQDSGDLLGTGATGLLEVRSNRFGEDAEWVRTTDLASIDSDGFLFIHGRSDAAIIRGGFKVLPEAVAEVLQRHPAVREAAVAGLPDQRLGAVPVAAVELVEGGEACETGLLDFARQHLTAYQVPVSLKIVGELPRTPSMKVALPAIRALFESPADTPGMNRTPTGRPDTAIPGVGS